MKRLLSYPFAELSTLPVRSLLATFSILCCANLHATDHTIAAGETFNLSNASNTGYTDKVIANAGSIIEVPSSLINGKDQIIRIKFEIAGAGVTLRFADKFTAPFLTAGIRATADDASLIIDCPGKLQIGRFLTAATDVNFPPVEIANMAFSNPSSTGLELYNCVTVRQLPTNCNIKVQNNATLALQGTNVLEPIGITNKLTLTNWDVIALTASSLPQNCRVVVNAGRTFAFHPAGKNADGTGVPQAREREFTTSFWQTKRRAFCSVLETILSCATCPPSMAQAKRCTPRTQKPARSTATA